MSPTISIVVPCYNAERFIRPLLDSIINQTFGGWECVAVNDGSTDGTWAILQEYARRDARILAFNSFNRGIAGARNFAFEQTDPNSDYVIYMDHDDVYLPNALETLVETCRSHPDFIGAHALADMIDLRGQAIAPGGFSGYGRERLTVRHRRIVHLSPEEPSDFTALLVKSPYPPGAVIVRRSVAEQLHGMDESMVPVDDRDFWIRAGRHGAFAFVDQVLIYYRRHDRNGSSNCPALHAKDRFLRYQTHHSPENTPEQQRLMREFYRAWQLMKMREKRASLGDSIRKGNLKEAIRLTVHVAGHALRFVRGSPTAHGG